MLMTLILAASEATTHTSSFDWAAVFAVIRNIISVLLMLGGLYFVLGGTLGVLRLPDFYTRMHAAGMTDTLGAELILFSLVLQAGFSFLSLKILLVAFFLFITSPTATHAVASAAYQAGLDPLLGPQRAPDYDEEGQT